MANTDLSKAGWLQDKRLKKLFAVIERGGGQARIAGGAVRNLLWGLPISDIDVATTLPPDEMAKCAGSAGFSVHPTGIEHGTLTIVVDGLSLEVTTLRADVETDGRHAVVAFTNSWQQDAARRDFSINALYCDLVGNIFDETGLGLKDIKARRIRFVGDASERIKEDYLRIVRYFRFEAQYGQGNCDPNALQACAELKAGLQQISAERKQSELFKVLLGANAISVIEQMANLNILDELISLNGTVEMFARLVGVEKRQKFTPNAIERLACLTSITNNLKLSKADRIKLEGLTGYEKLTPELNTLQRKEILYRMGKCQYLGQVKLSWADDAGKFAMRAWRELYDLAINWQVPIFPVSGRDLLAQGIPAGANMGKLLKQQEEAWISSNFKANKAALMALVK